MPLNTAEKPGKIKTPNPPSLGSMVKSSPSAPRIEVPQQKHYGEGMSSGTKVSGFYYDTNRGNDLMSVSLHYNSVLYDDGSWGEYHGAKDDNGYSYEPLCRAIMTEDYQAAISNSWSEFGDEKINDIFNQFKPYAPYLSFFSKELEKMNSAEEEMKTGSEEDRMAIFSTIGQIFDKTTDVLEKLSKAGTDYLNRALVTKTGRFSYYSGTGVGFGNLTIKFTIFSDYVDGKFKSVYDQVMELYPYCFGKLVKFLNDSGEPASKDDTEVALIKELVDRYFGWQIPPGGFKAELDNIDKIQFGTLKLKFGSLYAIDNLVCESATFQMSKQMMKRWDTGSKENDLCPLSCDITMTFKPASKFTDVRLKRLIGGDATQKERQAMELILQDNINKKIEENKKLLGG